MISVLETFAGALVRICIADEGGPIAVADDSLLMSFATAGR